MKLQNINLLKLLSIEQSVYFTLRFLKILILAIIVFLGIIYFIFVAINFTSAKKLMRLKTQRTSASNQIAKIAKTRDKKINPALKISVLKLQKQLAAKNRILNLLRSKEQIKFSSYLEAVSQIMPKDVWLDTIYIEPHQEYLKLSGHTLNASLVPYFVHELKNKKIFQKYKFSSIDVKKIKNKLFSFTIKSDENIDKNLKKNGNVSNK